MSRRPSALVAALVIVLDIVLAGRLSAQLVPNLLRGPYLQSPAPTSVVVRWRTDLPSDSRVRYGGADEGALDRQASVPGPRTEHSVRLEGLEPGRRYAYAVGSAAGDLATGSFRTPPVAGTREPVRIWSFGDAGDPRYSSSRAAVRDAFLGYTGERGAEVWIVLGDNAYFAGSDADYQLNFFQPYGGLLSELPVFSALGNHDGLAASSADGTGPYYEIFDLPAAGESGGEPSGTEAWYSFDHANVHFVALDSYESARTPASPMLEWLERDLAANTQEWTIAFFHHPVYSGGTHPSDSDFGTSPTSPDPADDFAIQEMRENVLPILEAGGVDLVLTAHSHNYERSFLVDGHYGTSDTLTEAMKLDSGNGRIGGDGAYRKSGAVFGDGHEGTVVAVVGSGAESSVPAAHPVIVASAGVPGSLIVDVDGSRLDGTFVAADGRVLDRFTILRGTNFPPAAADDQAATAPEVPVRIAPLANDVDPDDDLLLFESLGAPAHGAVADHGDGTVTYTPAPSFPGGEDAFTYTVTDGHGHRATATVRVTVTCPPTADGLFADDLEPGAEPGWRVETPVNDSPASATWTVAENASASSPTHAWSSASDAATSRKDDRLISPPLDLTSSSRLAFRHRYQTEGGFDGGVLEISADGGANWSDLGASIVLGGYDADTIRIDGVDRPAWTGTSGAPMREVRVDLGAWVGPGRLVRWRLVADEFTIDTTTGWSVDDVVVSGLASGPGRCNLAPLALDDVATTEVDRAVAIDVLANDSDPEGTALVVEAVGAPAHGTAAVAGGVVVYEPAAGYFGEDRFDYEATDGDRSARASVAVHVVTTGAEPDRARGHGEVDDGGSPARFAFHARREEGVASGWLRFRDVEGSVGDLRFPFAGEVEMTGVCWLADGSPCSFRANAAEAAAGARAFFAIELFDGGGSPIDSASGSLATGRVMVD